MVDKGTLNSVWNILQGIEFDLDFITNLWQDKNTTCTAGFGLDLQARLYL